MRIEEFVYESDDGWQTKVAKYALSNDLFSKKTATTIFSDISQGATKIICEQLTLPNNLTLSFRKEILILD
jgi:hypothetical protein